MNKSPGTLLRWSPAVLFGLTLLTLLVLFFRFQHRPEISDLDRLMAGPGDRLEITGEWFGDGEDGSKLYIGSHALTSTGILEWDDNRILARVPRSDGAVLVKVKTRSGTSRGVILGDAERFPEVDYGAWLPGAPYIEYADPPVGVPGDLISFHGTGFGDRRESGRVWVNRDDDVLILGMEEPDLSRYVEVTVFESWTDNEVRFRLPEGAGGGNAYLLKSGFFSNPVSVELGDVPGVLWQGDPVRWSLRQEVQLERIGAFPGNSLYLRIPAPVAGAGQEDAVVLDGPSGDRAGLVRHDASLSLYRLDELAPGDEPRIGRQLLVVTRPLRFQVESTALIPYDPGHPELASALSDDDWIRPDDVSQVSARAVRGVQGDWFRSRAIYDYVISLLEWNPEPPTRSIPDYIRTAQADSEGYSFLFTSLARSAGIPARPVGGLIIDADGNSRVWWWAEIWIEGLGWVPVDPALGDSGDGLVLPGSPGGEDGADFYFGGLEGRHIAFSRGILEAGALQPSPELRRPDSPYSLQGVWEEVSGNLESYVSHWPVPRVTAVYGVDR